jgi:hypothetical protein
MTFYNLNNQKITQDEWIKLFEPYYFLGGPTLNQKINRRTQGSKFVEDEIEKILKNGLEANDIPFVIAWKIGAIDHKASEFEQKVIFKKDFDKTFEFPDPYKGSGVIKTKKIIDYCKENFDYLKGLGDEAKNSFVKAEELFNNLKHNVGENNRFGFVKLLALLYFFTQRHWPIYDQFAHKAVSAIISNTKPHGHTDYMPLNDFDEYHKKYVEKIKEIFGRQDIERSTDRSLWVYGHFFNKNNNCNKTTNICRSQKKSKKS